METSSSSVLKRSASHRFSNKDVIFALKGISAEYCAAYALIKMFKKTLIIIPTFKMKAAILSAKLSPRKAALAITKHQQRKKL